MELKPTHLLLRLVGAVLALLIGASTVAVSGGALVDLRFNRSAASHALAPAHARHA